MRHWIAVAELFQRLDARRRGVRDAFHRPEGCREYAAWARRRLAQRIATEQKAGG